MSDQAVATEGLTKRYRGDVLAVDGVNLRVARGEVYAFLGLNGAGKSTTIRMLLGMIKPTAGHAELFGVRVMPWTNDLWRRVGYLVETATAYPELTVVENLDVAGRLAGSEDRGRVDAVIDRLALGAYASRRAGTLSLGNLQRLALARALLHGPELLILDEPANGLDPAGRRRDSRPPARPCPARRRHGLHVQPHPRRGRPPRGRIGIVHQGRLVEELDSVALEQRRDRRLEVETRDAGAAETALRAAGLTPQRRGEGRLELRDPMALEAPERVAEILVAAGAPPSHLAIARESLEEHFMRVTSDEAGAA